MSAYTSIGVLLLTGSVAGWADAQTPSLPELLAQASTLTADPGHGEILYLKHCTRCHGRHAWGDGPKEIPALAGQHEDYLLQQLARFAARERLSAPMRETLHPADVNRPQAFRDLAAYLSRASRSPHPDHGDGRGLSAGQQAYTRGCVACHGPSGEGREGTLAPAVGGQHYFYVLYRLQSLPTAHSDRVDQDVQSFIAALSPEDRQGLADYISRLTALLATGAR